MVTLAEASIASGQIRAEGNRRIVQHLEGGIAGEILTRDRDRVRAGQVMRLEPRNPPPPAMRWTEWPSRWQPKLRGWRRNHAAIFCRPSTLRFPLPPIHTPAPSSRSSRRCSPRGWRL